MGAPYARTKSLAAAAVYDVDGIKTSFGSTAAIKTIVPADFNGAILGAGASALDPARTIVIGRSSASNQYSVLPIVITGVRGGVVVTESLTPANDDGNDVLRGAQAFETITSVVIPADAGTGGAYTIGVQDICAPKGDNFEAVEILANGPLNVRYGEAADAPTDTIVSVIANRSFYEIAPTRVLTDPTLAAPTVAGVVVYYRQ